MVNNVSHRVNHFYGKLKQPMHFRNYKEIGRKIVPMELFNLWLQVTFESCIKLVKMIQNSNIVVHLLLYVQSR